MPATMRFAPLFALLLLACGDATGLLIEVSSSDLAVPAEVNVLRFEVDSNSGRMIDRTYGIDGAWPHSLTVAPADDADAEVIITVSAYQGAQFVTRRVVRASFDRGLTRRVAVELSRDCASVVCPDGIDCLRGMCVQPTEDGGVPVDAGVDGGGADAGAPRDGGTPLDAGDRDAGAPFDGGVLFDAGRDAGTDGGTVEVDAFVPVDSGPDIPRCNTNPSSCVGLLVISEIATGSTSSPGDEFVEIYNRSGVMVDASGVTVSYAARNTSIPSERASLPAGTFILPGRYYLVVASGYTGSPAPDPGGGWSTGFSAPRGAVLLEAGTQLLDLVGWQSNTETVSSEGSPIPDELSGTQSYERKANAGSTVESMTSGADATAGNGHDSGDNAADFIVRLVRSPQSSSSAGEP